MSNNLETHLSHARMDNAVFNLKKREVRIVLVAYLSPEVLSQREIIQRLTLTDTPLVVSIEPSQMHLDLDTGEVTD